jgi:signal transduction histidine kinase
MRPWVNWLKRADHFKILSTVAWLVFTVTFAIWWFKLSMDNIHQLAELQPERMEHWIRQKRMIFWEGTSWLVLLALGGGALIGFVQKEKLRVKRIREFFASFSHEIKTSLASLRLQAEALKDDLGNQTSPILDRLIGDTVRLQVQLENSLFFASQDNLQLFVQPVRLDSLVERMREQWPNLKIDFKDSIRVTGDERALRTVLSNLVQNAHVHGGATQIEVKTSDLGGDRLEIRVTDNGKGFSGDVASLGVLFHRPTPTSGSGLGLHICRLLLTRMGGDLRLESSEGRGFQAVMTVKGTRA